MSDVQVVRAVTSWALGFVVLLIAGVAVPVLASLLPDAIGLSRRRGEWKPLMGISALTVGLLVVAVYEGSVLGAPGSPSVVVWDSLTVLLGLGTSVAAGGWTVSRAVGRRAARRRALAAVMPAPDSAAAFATGTGRDRPGAVLRINAREAEHLACAWMQYLGVEDAIVTSEQRDGGVDVRSREYLAQVKHLRAEAVGVAAIRQLHGVAAAEGRRSLFFSTSGYTRDAIAFAREVDMALFVVRATEGRLVPHGVTAQQYYLHGLSRTPRPSLPVRSSAPASGLG